MSGQTIDYDGLAKQHGAVSSGEAIDYDALARQHGAVQSDQPGFLKRAWEMVDPTPLIMHPLDSAKAIFEQPGIRANQAIEAVKAGHYQEAVGRALEAIPVIGTAASAGEKMAEDLKQGNYSGAAGTFAGLVAPSLAGAGVSKVASGTSLPKLGGNAKAVTAAKEALSEGVPVNLASVTDNRFIRGGQEMAASTMTGAPVATWGTRAEKAGFANWADRLKNRAAPAEPPSVAYAEWDRAAADPANVRPVPTAPKRTPLAAAALDSEALTQFKQGYASLDQAQKNMVESAVRGYGVDLTPVAGTEQMALPVKVKDLKPQARAFLAEREGWTPAKKQSDPAYALAQMIANGGDYVPAKTAEVALSGLKNRMRQLGSDFSADTSVNVERGQAAGFTQRLQQAIDRDVSAVDPKAATSLQLGRRAAARQAGSDWLGETFADATAQGEWSGAQGMWRKWQKLDPAEKNTMFPNPMMRQSLENLFLAAKRAEMVSAGSRTAPLTAAGSSAQALLTGGAAYSAHPVLGALGLISPAVMMQLAYSPRFVSAAIAGLKIPGNKMAATMAAGQILKLAAEESPVPAPGQMPAAAQSNDPSGQSAPLATVLIPQ